MRILLAAWLSIAVYGSAPLVDSVPLFASDAPLEFTLVADFGELKGDRGDDPPGRPATVRVLDASGSSREIEAQLAVRGDFRRSAANCTFPPLRLNLKKKQVGGTEFDGQDKLKIVASCRPGRDSYEQLVLLEYLSYRVFSLITDTSFRVRLAKITYVDVNGKDEPETRLAFLIEDDGALAARVGAEAFSVETGKNLPPEYFDPMSSVTLSIFQYMIGNTDWSEVAVHNVSILDDSGVAVPVPYDFDFSGLVDAPYAIPAEGLGIRTVKERLYLGYCREGMNTSLALQRFRDARERIVQLISDFELLSDRNRDRTVRYLESFYDDIETDAGATRVFLRYCRALPAH